MLCFNIIGNIACVQITGEIQNFISALLKVFKTFVKQLVIIGFETDFAVRLQECFVHFKLFVVCKSALFVLCSRPRIAEVDEKSVNLIVSRNDFVKHFNIVFYK